MPQFQRRGGVVQLQGTPLYLPGFHFELVNNKLVNCNSETCQ